MELSPLFFKIGALGAFYFAITQSIQFWLTTRIPKTQGFDEAMAVANHPYNVLRYWLVLSSMFLLIFAFGGVALAKFPLAPELALFGFVFSLLFVFSEILYRSVELFGVHKVLIPQYLSETDPTVKASQRALIEAFTTGVIALYFPLLVGHLFASVLFGLATIGGGGLETLVGLFFFVNALRLLIRTLAMHGGVKALESISQRIYFPVVISTFAVIGLWLWTL